MNEIFLNHEYIPFEGIVPPAKIYSSNSACLGNLQSLKPDSTKSAQYFIDCV